jgi:hypothetical protein
MTDTSNSGGRTLGTVLGIKGKPKPPGPMPQLMSEQEQHNAAIVYALSATEKLREERDLALNRVQQLSGELAAVKADTARELMDVKSETANELMAQKAEYEGNIANARADNSALRRQLGETGEKLEKYERWCFQIQTKCEDLQKYFNDQLNVIEDAKNHVALGVASATNHASTVVSTAMSQLHEAGQHATEGLGKQVAHILTDSRSFLAELQAKAVDTPYRPEPKPEPRRPLRSVEELSEQAEAELNAWIGKRKTIGDESNEPVGP